MEPFSLSAVLAVAIACCTILYLLVRKGQGKTRQLPPGPQGLERLKELFYAVRSGRVAELAARLGQKYGDIVRVEGIEPGLTFVFFNNVADVRDFYTDKTQRRIVNSRHVNCVSKILMPDITFSSPEDKFWAKERKLFHQSLKFYGEGYDRMERTIQKELQDVVDRLHDQAGQDVEVRSFFFNSVLNLMHILLTGDQLAAESPKRQAMAAYVQSVIAILNPGFVFKVEYFPFLLYLPGSVKTIWEEFNGNHDRIMQYFYHDIKATHTAGNVRGTVDDWLDKMESDDSKWLTEEHIQAMIGDILLGGTVTTSETLTSMFLFLLNHRDVVAKIQAEVDRVVGPDQWPSLEHRDLCHYTQATVLEIQRMICLLPISIPHKVVEDTEFKGYFFPKGTLVCANQWAFHRSETAWTNPLEFRPERFLDDQGKLLPATHPLRLQMLPFGVGMRSCPGESFARARMFLYVTTILQHFDPLPPQKGVLPPLTPNLDSWEMSAFMVVKGYSCQFAKREKK